MSYRNFTKPDPAQGLFEMGMDSLMADAESPSEEAAELLLKTLETLNQ
jgi:hypothetical protein